MRHYESYIYDSLIMTHRFLLEWISFLCRYVPVGIIEGLNQTMNKRPPPYFGRNELGMTH